MGARGPAPKTVHELKLRGTYREDRHAARAIIPNPTGTPTKPKSLTGEASKFWDEIVPQLVEAGSVRRLDVKAIVVACEAWALYRKVLAKVNRYPFVKDYRMAYRAYHASLQESIRKLGLSPADRARLVGNGPAPVPESPTSISGFARRRV
jgi:P27 family predicted phage terminase small subunit